jgi:hypothetical protein
VNDLVTLCRPTDGAVAQMRALASTLADDLVAEAEQPVDTDTAEQALYDALYDAACSTRVQTRRAEQEDRRMDATVRSHMMRGAL